MKMNTSYYPQNWPSSPFHAGEVAVQKRLQTHKHVMSYAPKVIRPYIPDQHRDFFSSQPFLVVAARDHDGKMWSSLLFASDDSEDPTSFVSSPDPTRLSIQSKLLSGDALAGSLIPGSDFGILGIEFSTRRRNRVNGRLVDPSEGSNAIEFKVDQSFGNCPQYIKSRDWWVETNHCQNEDGSEKETVDPKRSVSLDDEQKSAIQKAETVFLATGYRGEGEDPRYGNDASHRGGASGFIHVEGNNKLLLPDYSGNNHFNTFGNLELDSRMGLAVPIFETGGMLQMSGTSIVRWDGAEAKRRFPGALRFVEFTIDEVVQLPPGSLPIRWSEQKKNQLQLQVAEKAPESLDVMSFYLGPVPGDAPTLPSFQPGQHLPITIDLGGGEVVDRTYSLSANSTKSRDYYRISVKRDPFGRVSRYLHDTVQAGDIITVEKPSGDFVYDDSSDRPLLLLSSGIGVTPILPMLYKFVENLSTSSKTAYWIYTTSDGKHHPFRGEVERLRSLAKDRLKMRVIYTKPRTDDSSYHSAGRITARDIANIVPDLANADVYMCGSAAFVSDLSDGLEASGVHPSNLHFEDFSS